MPANICIAAHGLAAQKELSQSLSTRYQDFERCDQKRTVALIGSDPIELKHMLHIPKSGDPQLRSEKHDHCGTKYERPSHSVFHRK